MEFPTLFSSDEVDALIAALREPPRKRVEHHLSDPEQLIQSIAAISTVYPTIANRIELTWGTHELQNYLNGLVIDSSHDSGNPRQGFPPMVMGHLLKLHRLNFRAIGAEIETQTWKGIGG